MRCANLSFLNKLIQSYPKSLFVFRAFTHALAYFNSCLNPYLYALLNRNFCMELADICPTWRSCFKHTDILENEHYTHNTNLQIFRKRSVNLDEDELDYHDQVQPTNDVSCQVELLRIKSNKCNRDTSSFNDEIKLN